MTFYHNGTRHAAIVTIRVVLVKDPKAVISMGTPSTMKTHGLDQGIHDLLVEPGGSIELMPDVEAEFISARGAL